MQIYYYVFLTGTNTSQDQCNNGNEISLTEYNTTNTSNYYNHDGTKGIAVQKV